MMRYLEHLEDGLLDGCPGYLRILRLEVLDEVLAEHLLEVALVRVVHDGEVLLVDVQVLQLEGLVGESQPEPVVSVNLRRMKNAWQGFL